MTRTNLASGLDVVELTASCGDVVAELRLEHEASDTLGKVRDLRQLQQELLRFV